MSVQKRRRKSIERRQHVNRLVQCDGTCHDRDEECRRCERLIDGALFPRIVGCDDCIFYASQDAEATR